MNRLPEKKVKNKKLVFGVIGLIIVLAVTSGFTLYYFLAAPAVYVDQPEKLPSGYITADEAIKIATPYLNQHANENHYKIAEIYVSFSNSTLDILHTRSNSTMSYPEWTVTAEFLLQQSTEDWAVSLWADTGEVSSQYAPNQHYYA